MNARSGRLVAWSALSIVVAALAGACGSDRPEVWLSAEASWNQDPGTADEIGYRIGADVGWPDRQSSCFPLSRNLRIRVNDREATPMVDGDCVFDVLVMLGAFQQNVPISIQLVDGDQVIAQASYQDLLLGANAKLLTPADGRVKAGDPITVSLPIAADQLAGAKFYWLDTAPGVPPFNTFSPGSPSADGLTFQTTAPTITGRAALVIESVFTTVEPGLTSCTGFKMCSAVQDSQVVGPVFVEVVP